MKPLFIAEVKTQSPFGFNSEHSWGELLALAVEHGDMVAVHTDERWGGSFTHLIRASRAVHRERKLLLAKGIHESDEEIRKALDFGADLVLVVGRIPSPELAPVCIWEPSVDSTIDEYDALKIMWNQRDLNTGKRRRETFREARDAHWGWLCQASFIKTFDDVSPRADAFIVGEHLSSFIASRSFVGALQ